MTPMQFIRSLYELIGKYLDENLDTVLPEEPDELEPEPEKPISSDNPFTIKDDRLYMNGKPVPFYATTKKGGKFDGARFVINHYTANNSLKGTINVFKKYSVSAHIIVDRDGTVVQMVPFNEKAWHSGKSHTTSKWGTDYNGLNAYSVGIEFINYGYKGGHVPSSVDTSDWPLLSHKNENGTRYWQPYTEEQINVAAQLNGALMKHYNIPVEHIKGHDDISPNRKTDPGPLFPMSRIKREAKGYA